MWVSDVAEPDSTSGDDPSPQLTVIDDIVPSGSVAEKLMVRVWPVIAWLGRALLIVRLGDSSLTFSVAAALVRPLLSVAIAVIVKVWIWELPMSVKV